MFYNSGECWYSADHPDDLCHRVSGADRGPQCYRGVRAVQDGGRGSLLPGGPRPGGQDWGMYRNPLLLCTSKS